MKTDYINAIERVILTAWVGGIWITGFLVAPALFGMLDDRSMAGSLAGSIFTRMSYLGLISGCLLLCLIFYSQKKIAMTEWRNWIIEVMLLLIVIGEFVLQPKMAELRNIGLAGNVAKQFAILHGVSSMLFLINAIAGLVLVISRVRPRQPVQSPN